VKSARVCLPIFALDALEMSLHVKIQPKGADSLFAQSVWPALGKQVFQLKRVVLPECVFKRVSSLNSLKGLLF
jgi:hypothetical protein